MLEVIHIGYIDGDHSHVLPMIKDLQKTCQDLEINRAFHDSIQSDPSIKWPNFLTLVS